MPPADSHPQGELTITPDLTLPKLMLQTARRLGDGHIALREKEYGIWRPITWREYVEAVKEIALGFVALGLERGDKVALIGDNRPEGLFAEMAALAVGGVAVWLFQDSLIDEVQYIVDHCDAKILVGEGQEEVDKGLAIRDRCPKLEKIVWDDPRGMRHYDDPMLIGLPDARRLGRELDEREPDLFKRLVEQGQAEDVCLLFYTSGTTAKPKGALLTHHNMLKMGQNLLRVDAYRQSDDFVSYLPFAWIGEQMMSISCGLQAGFTLNFPEEPETSQDNIREIAPHMLFAPPRIYEQMIRSVQVRYLDASRLKRKAYELGIAIGYRVADAKFARTPLSAAWRLLHLVGEGLLFRSLRDHLGLSRARYTYSGGAALGPDHFRFFHAIGVNLKQIYGQTEIAGISVLHRDGDVKFDTVGKPIPETEVQITPEGEIIARSPSVFQGYYKNPEATAQALRSNPGGSGLWLHSGDTGFIDQDGHLVVFDRSGDVMILSDGSKFSPQYIESRLKFSPYLQDAWVLGDQRPFVTAVLCIAYNVVGKWAEERNIAYTSYTELSQKPEIYTLVGQAIREMNRRLPDTARIQRFVNLYKAFDADDDELTRTRKLRRRFLEERYQDIVRALYADQDIPAGRPREAGGKHGASSVHVDTTITYEDGRVARIKADLRVEPVDELGVRVGS